jgi:hypothetical protein
MSPTEQYSRNFAKVVYHEDNLDCLDDTDRHEIARIFDHFKSEYHDLIADYPKWVNQPKNATPRDLRRVKQYEREGWCPMFLFSHARIEAYVRQHL